MSHKLARKKVWQSTMLYTAGGKRKKTSEVLDMHSSRCKNMLRVCKVLFRTKVFLLDEMPIYTRCVSGRYGFPIMTY